MNTKQLGNLGVIKVASKYIELGYEVFIELGDNSNIDLIVIKDNVITKIQVKTTKTIHNNKMKWEVAKRRLNYKGHRVEFYNKEIDGFALCCLENDYIGYVPYSEKLPKYAIVLNIENARKYKL